MRHLAFLALLLSSLTAAPRYADEFHTSASLAHYATCYDWGCSPTWNGELETYRPASVSVANGKLDLRATHTPSGYQSGMVTTSHRYSFLYGRLDVRAQLPRGQGLWPAIWLLAQGPGAPKYTELDVMEVLGNAPNQIHSGVHWADGSNHHQHQGITWSGPDLSAGYHVFSVDWRADHITWLLDGHAYYSTRDVVSIPHTPLYLLANLAVGGNWPGSPSASTPFPADFLIDWVHISA